MMNDTLLGRKQYAEQLLQAVQELTLACVNEQGFPYPVIMSKVFSQGLAQICFVAKTGSRKTNHFRRNAKAGICCACGDDSLSLLGTVQIVEDESEKKKLLPASHYQRICAKGSENYCVLLFTTNEAKLYANGLFTTFSVET